MKATSTTDPTRTTTKRMVEKDTRKLSEAEIAQMLEAARRVAIDDGELVLAVAEPEPEDFAEDVELLDDGDPDFERA